MFEGFLRRGFGLTTGAGFTGVWFRRLRHTLLDCLPSRLRAWIGRERPRLEFFPAGEQLEVQLDKAGEIQPLGRYGRADAGELKQMLSRTARDKARTSLVAAGGDVLIRRIQLPTQVKENLARVLEYEIDRLTPFSAAEVYFDYRLIGGAGGSGQLSVELAVMKRSRMQRWLDLFAEAGVKPARLTWQGAWDEANLFPASMRQRGDRRTRYLAALLWFVLLALITALAVTPLWQKRVIASDMGERLSQVRRQAAEVADLKAELEDAAQSANFVFRQKHSSPYAVELLRILTELIPDNSWVFQLDLNDGKVEIRGESTQATNLIEILAQEPAFRNVTFKSPVVGVKNTDQERFHIVFDYAVSAGGG
jgi:general secretion pathway protein L